MSAQSVLCLHINGELDVLCLSWYITFIQARRSVSSRSFSQSHRAALSTMNVRENFVFMRGRAISLYENTILTALPLYRSKSKFIKTISMNESVRMLLTRFRKLTDLIRIFLLYIKKSYKKSTSYYIILHYVFV